MTKDKTEDIDLVYLIGFAIVISGAIIGNPLTILAGFGLMFLRVYVGIKRAQMEPEIRISKKKK